MMNSIQIIGQLSYDILHAHRKVIDIECEVVDDNNEAHTVEISTTEYDRMRFQIETNNSGEGCMSFCETFECSNYNAMIEGTMWRTFTTSGDGYFTPVEEMENIEINVESFHCYNAAGAEIESDFDAKCIE